MDTWSQVVVKILCMNTFSFLLTTPRNSYLASIFSKLSWDFSSIRFQSPNPIKHIDVCQIKAAAGNRFMDVSDLLSTCICNELIAGIAIGWWLIPSWTSQYLCLQIYNWTWCCLSLNSPVFGWMWGIRRMKPMWFYWLSYHKTVLWEWETTMQSEKNWKIKGFWSSCSSRFYDHLILILKNLSINLFQ